MDSEPFETIVLEIVTNLNTRFLVVPLRCETIGDIRGTIKSFHMDLFPKWGAVDVLFMEGAGAYRLVDCLRIRHLFLNEPRGTLFAELIPSARIAVELPRLNIAGATGGSVVYNHELRQNPAESTLSPRRRRLAEGQSIPNLENSSDRNSALGRKVVHGTHGHGSEPEVVERQLRTMKRGIDERGSPSDAQQRQVQAECAAVDVRQPVTGKICDDMGSPVLERTEPETGDVTRNHSVRKSAVVVEPTTRIEHLQLRKVSLPEPCQHSSSPLLEKDHEIALSPLEPIEKDAVSNGARALDTCEFYTTDVARRSKAGHPIAGNLPAETGLENPEDVDVVEREAIRGTKRCRYRQNKIANGRQADLIEVVVSSPERRIRSGGASNLNGVFNDVNPKCKDIEGLVSSTSGSFDETCGRNEDSEGKVPELLGDYKSSSSDGSSAESEGEEDSKLVSPREGSVGKDSDQSSSDGDCSQPSNFASESENIEPSGDDSVENDPTPPTV